MLIHQDRVAVRIDDHKAGGAGGGFFGFGGKGDALRLELALQFPHIGKTRLLLRIAVPARVEG